MNKKNLSFPVFILFSFITLLFYLKTSGAGFVTDEIGWLQNYKDTGWQGIFHAFGDKSLHYVYHLFGFLLWKLFGLNGFLWMMTFVILHAGVAALSFNVFNKLFTSTEISFAPLIAFAGSLLFVVSPYQTEPLIWYACIHYLACSLLLFLAFNFLLNYLQKSKAKFIAAFYCCFFLSLFTLEISFVFPIILFVFFLFWPSRIFINADRFRLIKIFVVPTFSSLVVYFFLSKILRGSIVGHYGTSQHLNFDIPLLIGNLCKYIFKIFFLTQFASYNYRHSLYLVFERREVGWLLLFVFVGIVILYTLFQKKLGTKFLILCLLFVFFAIALLPILNLYFSYLVNVEGDRFTYFPSVFAYQFMALFSVVVFRKFGWILLMILLFFNMKFLRVNTESWSNSCLIQNSLIEKFRWYDAKKIYLLNLPDNFRGTYMFRGFPPDNFFARTLTLKKGRSIEEKTSGILEYNMNSITDSVKVEMISDNELKVCFGQQGNWWWHKGIGGSNYSTDDFDVKIDEWSFSYNIVFKNKIANSVYLYQCGAEWREVKDF